MTVKMMMMVEVVKTKARTLRENVNLKPEAGTNIVSNQRSKKG